MTMHRLTGFCNNMAASKALSTLIICGTLFTTNPLHAAPPTSPVTESELHQCLLAEAEGIGRFDALKTQADALRALENELRKELDALNRKKSDMAKGNPSRDEQLMYNASVDKFNVRGDDYNARKDAFNKQREDYELWMNKTVKPACSKAQNNEGIPVMVIFYACGLDAANSKLAQVPFCKALENKALLASCAKKAGNKTKAMETCGTTKSMTLSD